MRGAEAANAPARSLQASSSGPPELHVLPLPVSASYSKVDSDLVNHIHRVGGAGSTAGTCAVPHRPGGATGPSGVFPVSQHMHSATPHPESVRIASELHRNVPLLY